MKKILALLVLATLGRADVVGPMPMQLPADGGLWPVSGSVTYALNNALTGVASSAIDTSGSNGVYLTLSGTANGLVSVWFSNANVSPTTGAIAAYQVQVPGNYYVPIKARYMLFTNDTQKAGVKVSAFYYLSTPSITVSPAGGGSIGVTVTSNTASYLPNTITVLSGVSYTTTVYNVSSVAQTTVPQMLDFSSPGGAAGFKILWTTISTPLTYLVTALAGDYVAASTTSQYFGPMYGSTTAGQSTIAQVYCIGGPCQIVVQSHTAK